MNIIHQLKAELTGANAEAKNLVDAMQQFKSFLHSAKFQGAGNDYIQTADVLAWLDATRREALLVRDEAQLNAEREFTRLAELKAQAKREHAEMNS